MSRYLEPNDLKEMIVQAKADGEMSSPLAQAIGRIALGIWERKGSGRKAGIDPDDFQQDVVLHMMSKLHCVEIDRPAQEIFNYMTTVAAQCLRIRWVKKKRREEWERKHRDQVIHDHLWELRIRRDHRADHERPAKEGDFGRIRK